MTRKRKRKIYARKPHQDGWIDGRRVHRFRSRAYCDTCGRSFNKDRAEAAGHIYTPAHADYYGEWVEEHTMCKDCVDSLNAWCDEEMKRMDADMALEQERNDEFRRMAETAEAQA